MVKKRLSVQPVGLPGLFRLHVAVSRNIHNGKAVYGRPWVVSMEERVWSGTELETVSRMRQPHLEHEIVRTFPYNSEAGFTLLSFQEQIIWGVVGYYDCR